MDKVNKAIIKKILGCDVSKPMDTFGDVISSILFKSGKSALFVNRNNHSVSILLQTALEGSERRKEILNLVELLAIMDDLEKGRLIYVQEDTGEGINFFYEDKKTFETGQIPGKYKVAPNICLNLTDLESVVLEKDRSVIMTSSMITSQVALDLSRYLCGRVFPTKSLAEYTERGFKTKEERSIQLGLRYSVISMFIAVIVAAVTPLFSVKLSNSKGISTIKQSQMDSLLQTAKPVYIIHQKDTANTLNQQILKQFNKDE